MRINTININLRFCNNCLYTIEKSIKLPLKTYNSKEINNELRISNRNSKEMELIRQMVRLFFG